MDLSFLNNKYWLIDSEWGDSQRELYMQFINAADSTTKGIADYRTFFESGNGAFVGGSKVDAAKVDTPNTTLTLKLAGVMMANDGLCHTGIGGLINDIKAAQANPNISNVIFDINSGGGEVTAAAMLYDALATFDKPIVGVATLMASGALLGTLPIKTIVAANEFARVGSIGVMTSLNKEAFAEDASKTLYIYASKSPDKHSVERQYRDKGDTSLLQAKLDEVATLFHDKVKNHRDLKPDSMAKALAGDVFLASEALSMGLVASIGFKETLLTNKNNDNGMFTIKNEAWASLVAKVSNFFSASTPLAADASIEQVISLMETAEPLQTQINSILGKLESTNAAFETQKTEMATAMAASNQKISDLEAALAVKDAKIAEMNSQLEANAAALIEFQGKNAGTPAGNPAPGGTAATVTIVEGELVTFAGSKY